MYGSDAGRKMEEIELLGQVCMNSLCDQEGGEGYLSFLVKEADACPREGWRLCVEWFSLCRTQWVWNLAY